MSDFPLRKQQQQQQQHMGLIHWILPNNNLRQTYFFSIFLGAHLGPSPAWILVQSVAQTFKSL